MNAQHGNPFPGVITPGRQGGKIDQKVCRGKTKEEEIISGEIRYGPLVMPWFFWYIECVGDIWIFLC